MLSTRPDSPMDSRSMHISLSLHPRLSNEGRRYFTIFETFSRSSSEVNSKCIFISWFAFLIRLSWTFALKNCSSVDSAWYPLRNTLFIPLKTFLKLSAMQSSKNGSLPFGRQDTMKRFIRGTEKELSLVFTLRPFPNSKTRLIFGVSWIEYASFAFKTLAEPPESLNIFTRGSYISASASESFGLNTATFFMPRCVRTFATTPAWPPIL